MSVVTLEHERNRSEIMDMVHTDRMNFDIEGLPYFKVCTPDDPRKEMGIIVVRRTFTEESVEVLRELRDEVRDRHSSCETIYESGYSVTLFDFKDAKYTFAYAGQSLEEVKPEVVKEVEAMPKRMECGIGYGILVGAPKGKADTNRYLAVSLDIKTRSALIAQRLRILKAMGIEDVRELSPHASLLRIKNKFPAAKKATTDLNKRAIELDEYVDRSGERTLKLVLGEAEIIEKGLMRRC